MNFPEKLPIEFAEYLNGLIAMNRGEPDKARQAWKELLGLPEKQRAHRSVWAAFMLGKLELRHDPAAAIPWFIKTRDLARGGSLDTLGLAASSLGWEAQADWSLGQRTRAIELYLRQNACGDPTALDSLAIICGRVFKDGKGTQLQALAADPLSARTITAYIVADGGRFRPVSGDMVRGQWLDAIEAVNAGDIVGADRLAWVAYQANDMKEAERWLKRAGADSPIGLWVHAKLLLRAGNLPEAARFLASASRSFPQNEIWNFVGGGYAAQSVTLEPAARVSAELGAIQLARGQYVESLDLLLHAGWWLDGAYVAERVLKPDELRRYIDASWPPPPPRADLNSDDAVPTQVAWISSFATCWRVA